LGGISGILFAVLAVPSFLPPPDTPVVTSASQDVIDYFNERQDGILTNNGLLLVFAAFFWVLVVLTVIDLEHRLLPNRIVYPAFVVGWIGLTTGALSEGRPEALIGAALGALIFGGFFLLIALVYPAGMGGGDVKLALVLGSFLGYEGGVGVTLAGMFLSFLLGGVVGVTITVVKGGGRKSQVPFGPFLAAGTIIAVLGGESIVDAYLSSL